MRLAQRATLRGSFSSTPAIWAESLSASIRESSESTCEVREMSRVSRRLPQPGQAGEASTAARLRKKMAGRALQSRQRYS